MIQSCDETLKTLEEELNKINENSPKEDLPELSEDHGLGCEDNEDQKDKDNDGRKENRSGNDDADGSKDTEDGTEKGNKRELIGITPEEAMKMLQRQNEKRRQDLKSKIDDQKNEKEIWRQRSEKAKAKVQELESKEEKLKGEQNRKEREQEEMDNEEDRLHKAEEWSKQNKRKLYLRSMKEQVQYIRRRRMTSVRRRYKSEPTDDESEFDDESDESVEQKVFQQLDKILQDARALEDLITDDRRLREQVDRKRDLRIVLGSERYHEYKWLQQVGRPVMATQDANSSMKDHLASNPLQGFNYEPLGTGEIRLLLLMPSPKECADYPLICALVTRSWKKDKQLEYAALSYHWGPDSENGKLYLLPKLPIKLEEADWGSTVRRARRISIRNSLFRALLRLRRHDNLVALWVDSLCIDQSNNKEKTEQLDNMAKVYYYADNVCIWLGEGDDKKRSDNAMDFIPAIMDFAVLDRYAKDKQQAGNWYALAELMRDRWFSRRWVVQEISLAKSATVHCGGKTVHWSDFVDAVSLLASNQGTIKTLFDYSKWREGPNTLGDVHSFGAYILLEATSKLFLRDAKGGIRMPRTNIESLVTSLTTFDTSDRRDLIYSLVSIAQDTSQNSDIYSRPASQRRRRLNVDYGKTPIDVFKDFTKFCINSSNSLDIICRPWAMPKGKAREDER